MGASPLVVAGEPRSVAAVEVRERVVIDETVATLDLVSSPPTAACGGRDVRGDQDREPYTYESGFVNLDNRIALPYNELVPTKGSIPATAWSSSRRQPGHAGREAGETFTPTDRREGFPLPCSTPL